MIGKAWIVHKLTYPSAPTTIAGSHLRLFERFVLHSPGNGTTVTISMVQFQPFIYFGLQFWEIRRGRIGGFERGTIEIANFQIIKTHVSEGANLLLSQSCLARKILSDISNYIDSQFLTIRLPGLTPHG